MCNYPLEINEWTCKACLLQYIQKGQNTRTETSESNSPRSGMELVGSSSLFSWSFIFGGGGGGGGLMLPTPDEEGEDVEDDTIGPEVILNSGSVLNTIVDVCILLHFLFISKISRVYIIKYCTIYNMNVRQSKSVPIMPLNKITRVFILETTLSGLS